MIASLSEASAPGQRKACVPYRLAPTKPSKAEGRHRFWGTWEDYKYSQAMAERTGGMRATYLDGRIEIMTLSLEHEMRKRNLSCCLDAWLFEQDIDFYCHGSATLEAKVREAGKEPDESYCFHEQKEFPDLVIEIAITRGGIDTLELYRRWSIPEVWIWHRSQLHVFHLTEGDYISADRSRWFPDLNLALLAECTRLDSAKEARKHFLARP